MCLWCRSFAEDAPKESIESAEEEPTVIVNTVLAQWLRDRLIHVHGESPESTAVFALELLSNSIGKVSHDGYDLACAYSRIRESATNGIPPQTTRETSDYAGTDSPEYLAGFDAGYDAGIAWSSPDN